MERPVSSNSSYSTQDKGNYMKGHIDRIDVRRDHRELIALFYRIELKALVMKLMYEHRALSRLSITD